VTKVVTRSRRKFRGAAERLIGLERYADRASRLTALAAAFANPECNAWSNYWKVQILNLMATGTGVRLIPVNLRNFDVIEEIPSALALERDEFTFSHILRLRSSLRTRRM
jgi:hypothetical protein